MKFEVVFSFVIKLFFAQELSINLLKGCLINLGLEKLSE